MYVQTFRGVTQKFNKGKDVCEGEHLLNISEELLQYEILNYRTSSR